MDWDLIGLAAEQLNVDALIDWRDYFSGLSVWMQAILVGVLVLLIGVSFLSCMFGFRMKKAARFAAGAAGVFYITMISLTDWYEIDPVKALIAAAVAGAAGGVLYAFLERVFQFAAGAVFANVFAYWLLPKYFKLNVYIGTGRVWALVITIAGGVLFAFAAKKLKIVLTALEGGVILGLVCGAFFPVDRIPWVKDRLNEAQIRNLLPVVLSAVGLLVQLIQFLVIWREQRALRVPAGEEKDNEPQPEQEEAASQDAGASDGDASAAQDEAISITQAEEVLVEKAKELAMAAARSTQQTRLRERCEDVSQGLYDAKIAADRLGMTEDGFLQEMKKAGYALPGEAGNDKKPEAESAEQPTAGSTEQPDAGIGEPADTESAEQPDTGSPEQHPDVGTGEQTDTESAEQQDKGSKE